MTTDLKFPRPLGAVNLAEFSRDGHRPITFDEADALRWGQLVTILDSATGDLSYGTVHSFARGESVRVDLRNGATLDFDLDNPDLWPDDREGDRNPPMCDVDGHVLVLVTTALAVDRKPDPEPLFNALKASTEIADLKARVVTLEAALDRQANFLQGLPTLEQHQALVADIHELHRSVALNVRIAS